MELGLALCQVETYKSEQATFIYEEKVVRISSAGRIEARESQMRLYLVNHQLFAWSLVGGLLQLCLFLVGDGVLALLL